MNAQRYNVHQRCYANHYAESLKYLEITATRNGIRIRTFELTYPSKTISPSLSTSSKLRRARNYPHPS